ncbi:MAG TPA: hypothetical protein VG184_04210 [Acidimicrobiales bacterium]|jgi:hypothetical protein|nr:hypothetical protein [Acidimicrobiales bacterium]
MAEDPFSGTGPAYLHHLLLAALTGPRAAGTAAPGRLVAQILLALHAAGGERLIGRYLAPVPGDAASYVVLTDDGDADPPAMAASQALTVAAGKATAARVEVVGEAAGGVRRRVFEGAPDSPLRYLWPEAVDYHGDDDACIDALERWAWLMDRWRAEPVQSGPPDQASTAGIWPPALPAVASMSRPDAVTASVPAIPTDAIADAVRTALGDVTVEVDLGAVERLVADALDTALENGMAAAGGDRPGTAVDRREPAGDMVRLVEAGRLAESGRTLDEIAERIAERVAERVASSVAAAARDAATMAGNGAGAGVAGAGVAGAGVAGAGVAGAGVAGAGVAGNLGQEVARQLPPAANAPTAEIDPRSLTQIASSVASLVPAPGATAEAVGEQVRQLLGPALRAVGERRIDDDRLARATLAAAAAELHLHLEAVTDRLRSGTRSLEALADELSARERTASHHVDRVAQRIELSLERLGRRVDERLDAASTPPDPDPGVAADEVRPIARDVGTLGPVSGADGAETIPLAPRS